MKTLKTTLLGTALLAVIAAPSFAAEVKKTKEIKELVGYNVTETKEYIGPYAKAFKKMDKDGNGLVNFKEYQARANVDNEYEMFSLIDKDQSKTITIEELINSNVTKGSTHFKSETADQYAVKGTNIRTRPLVEKRSYYVEVEPEVVEIKNVDPAAQ